MALGGMVGSWLGGKVGKGVGGLAVKGWQGLKSVAGKTKDMVAGGISAVGKGAAKLGSALVGGVGGLVKGGASLVGKGLSSVLGLDRDKYAKETAENTSKIYLLLKESKYFTSKSEDKGTENENTVEGSISDTVTGDNNAPASNTLKSLPVPKKGFDINSYNISNNQKIKDLGGKEINPENLKPNTAVASNTSTDSTTLNTNLKSTPSSEIATSTGTTAPVITGAKKPQSGSSKSTIIGAALGSALGPLGTIAGGYIGSKVGKMFAGKTESTIKPPNTPSSSSLSNISSLSGNTTQIAILRQISQNTAQTNNNIKQLANGLMNLSKSLLKTGSISQIPPEFNINAGGSEAPSGSPSLQSVFSQSDDIISRVRGEFAL
jgi:hypothetical protein